ncbi:hypothetical protein MNB_SUP05-5-370 [hydrothermal vent metagenome]|uniref:Uncharacterized protein n=1 Tax=hydrothermal vent metagenome TaxID=652676 RepID=A0A1W1BPS4_9ZZZZ
MDNSTLKGHILFWGTMSIIFVIPLLLILLSYVNIISGTADYIAAYGVIASFVYIIGGGIWSFIQDKKDLATCG